MKDSAESAESVRAGSVWSGRRPFSARREPTRAVADGARQCVLKRTLGIEHVHDTASSARTATDQADGNPHRRDRRRVLFAVARPRAGFLRGRLRLAEIFQVSRDREPLRLAGAVAHEQGSASPHGWRFRNPNHSGYGRGQRVRPWARYKRWNCLQCDCWAGAWLLCRSGSPLLPFARHRPTDKPCARRRSDLLPGKPKHSSSQLAGHDGSSSVVSPCRRSPPPSHVRPRLEPDAGGPNRRVFGPLVFWGRARGRRTASQSCAHQSGKTPPLSI